jgi:hypothetical protein
MKKLLLLFFISSFSGVFAQDIALTEDCTALTIGNLGTDPSGVTAGQNNWFTAGSTGASPATANANFQVVNVGGTNGNVIQINGSSTASTATQGQSRFAFQDLTNSWSNRTSGNDFVEVEFDLFSGPPTTSLSTFRNYIFDANGNAVAGFWFAPGPYTYTYTPTGGTATSVTATKTLRGWAYYDATASGGSVGYYTFKFGDTTTGPGDLILDDNTWYRIGVSYDYNTGAVTWKEANALFYTGLSTGPDAGSDIIQARFQVSSAVGNTLGANVQFDNVSIRYNSAEDLLGTKSNSLLENKLAIYPNPGKDVMNVAYNGSSINSIEISDLNGRVVKSISAQDSSNVQVNVSDLSVGVYMMKINSDKGTTTKKVIKE